MVPSKNDADAMAFAETIEDHTEAEIFMGFWGAGNVDAIKGHFPAFYAEGEFPPPAPAPFEVITGSAIQPSSVNINGNLVSLGDIVMGAFNDSKLTANQWNNELTQDCREDAIAQWIHRLTIANVTSIDDLINPFEGE